MNLTQIVRHFRCDMIVYGKCGVEKYTFDYLGGLIGIMLHFDTRKSSQRKITFYNTLQATSCDY